LPTGPRVREIPGPPSGDLPTSRVVVTFDVCSNASVNSDLSCFLYRGRLKRAYREKRSRLSNLVNIPSFQLCVIVLYCTYSCSAVVTNIAWYDAGIGYFFLRPLKLIDYCAVPNDSRRVIVTKLTLVVDGRPDVDLDLTGKLFIDSVHIYCFLLSLLRTQ